MFGNSSVPDNPCDLNITTSLSAHGGVPTSLVIFVPIWALAFFFYCLNQRYGHQHDAEDDADHEEQPLVARKNTSVSAYSRDRASSQNSALSSPLLSNPNESRTSVLPGYSGTWFSWMGPVYQATAAHVQEAGGRDAADFMDLIRTLLTIVVVVCFFSLVVALPVNLSGTMGLVGFSQTTISNLDTLSSKFGRLWAHTVLVYVNSAVAIFFLHRFARRVSTREIAKPRGRTVMIFGIPMGDNNDRAKAIHQLFRRAYSDLEVLVVEVPPDVSLLTETQKKLLKCQRQVERYEYESMQSGSATVMKQHRAGVCCCKCFPIGPPYDALATERAELDRLTQLKRTQMEKAMNRHSGIAFVTFRTRDTTLRCLTDYHKHQLVQNPSLQVNLWQMKIAPESNDIQWDVIAIPRRERTVRALLVNIGFVALLLFWTTPMSVLSTLEQIDNQTFHTSDVINRSALLTTVIPTILLYTITILMPVLVNTTAYWEKHSTISQREISVVRKSFAYAILSTVILPSLMLTSADAIVQVIFHSQHNAVSRIQCVFLPNNGAIFVNFVLFAALVGTALRLLPVLDGLVRTYKLRRAVTPRDKQDARESRFFTARFGQRYAPMCAIFCAILVFCTACPLIVPAGVLYFLVQYFVEKTILLKQARQPLRTPDGRLTRSAVNCVFVCVMVYQGAMCFFLGFKLGQYAVQTVLVVLAFLTTLALTILRLYGRIQLALPPVSQFTQDGVSEMMGTLDPVSESYIPPLCTTEDDMEAGNATRERKRRNKPMSMNEAVAHAEASASAAPLTALPWDAEDGDAQSYQRSDDARSHANVSTMYGSMTGESLDGVSTRAMIAPPSFQSSEQSSNDV